MVPLLSIVAYICPKGIFLGVAWKLSTGFRKVAQLLCHLCHLIVNDFVMYLNLWDGTRSISIILKLSGNEVLPHGLQI